MPNFIASTDAVGVLSNRQLPNMEPNPYFDLNSFLVTATGNWIYSTDYNNGGRNALALKLQAAGGFTMVGSDYYITGTFQTKRLLTTTMIDALKMLDSYGLEGDCTGYQAAVRLGIAEAETTLVPEYVPNNLVPVDPDDPESPMEQLTWSEWKDATHEHIVTDSDYYVPLCSLNNSHYLAGSIIVQLFDNGYDVIRMGDIELPNDDPGP